MGGETWDLCLSCYKMCVKLFLIQKRVELGYKDLGLFDISAVTLYLLW